MNSISDSQEALSSLYKKLPPVPCFAGCKGCCVSPTMTLVEFICLFNWMLNEYSQEEMEAFIAKPMLAHPDFEGNFFCRLQGENGLCQGHGGRALACRLHGLPVIEKLKIQNLENCQIMDKDYLPDLPLETAQSWLSKLVELNNQVKDNYEGSFYGLLAFNLEGWLDICFQENVANDLWTELRELLKKHLKEFSLAKEYKPLSQLADKMEFISLLELSIKFTDPQSTLESLKQLKKKFPSTGSYFQAEIDWMLERLQKN